MAFFLARYLELVPMACIGGILMWVAFNMVKPAEVKQVLAHGWFHIALMVVTAVMVIITDFLTGVLTGMMLYGVLFKFCEPRHGEDRRRCRRAERSRTSAMPARSRMATSRRISERLPPPVKVESDRNVWSRSMPLFHRLTVALARSPADAGLVRYAALVSRLASVREVCLVHVLAPGAGGPTSTHAEVGSRAPRRCGRGICRAAPSAGRSLRRACPAR